MNEEMLSASMVVLLISSFVLVGVTMKNINIDDNLLAVFIIFLVVPTIMAITSLFIEEDKDEERY